MKAVHLLLSLLILTLLVNSCKKEDAQPQTPLLPNGDVEQKFQSWFFNYDTRNPTNPNGYDFGFTSEAASSPQYSLKINCNAIKNDTTFCYYGQQKIVTDNIPIGAKLTLKAKIKTVLVGNGVSLAIRGDKNGKAAFFATTEGKTAITGTKDFTEYSVVLDSYPGNIDNLQIFMVYLPKTTGYVYFDDVSLTVN
ncbi:hypothetical protein [Spirosoma linguale]|uniref:Uncharacterized protein n=1 Tax=Spirosoma linguale (strain ATCC 33905 / DSM 74 / LMG 10896 / Claus 1) TaxID=504472 RepID=D2QF22_SPILD|nr:hypothetical protein Slin_5399 [Spirosoma linguale DSM 74]